MKKYGILLASMLVVLAAIALFAFGSATVTSSPSYRNVGVGAAVTVPVRPVTWTAGGSDTYTTDGISWTNASIKATTGFTFVDRVVCLPQGTYIPVYDNTNAKLKLYWDSGESANPGAFVEVENAATITSIAVDCLVFGR